MVAGHWLGAELGEWAENGGKGIFGGSEGEIVWEWGMKGRVEQISQTPEQSAIKTADPCGRTQARPELRPPLPPLQFPFAS